MRAPITDKHFLEMMWERFPEIMKRGTEQPAQQEPVIGKGKELSEQLKLCARNVAFVAAGRVDMSSAAMQEMFALIDYVCVGIDSPQPAQQEPVAYLVDGDLYYPEEIDWETLQEQGHTVAALYTSPPAQRTWVGLTDEQIDRLWSQSLADTESETWLPLREFARAIEAAHGIKEKNQ